VGNLGEDACSIAGFGIGIDRAAVDEVTDAGEGFLQNVIGFFAMDIGDKTDAAAVVFQVGTIHPLGFRVVGKASLRMHSS